MQSARLHVPVLLAAFLLAVPGGVLAEERAEEAQTVAEALKKGELRAGLRYRYEHVTDDGPMFGGCDGSASTLRTTLAYNTARVRGFDALRVITRAIPGTRLSYAYLHNVNRITGADASRGRFTTPLATGHAFNGWADRFLNTPVDGLEDLYVAVEGTAGPLAYALIYHEFGAKSTGVDYGSEIDANLVYASPWKQKFGVTLASFDSDGFEADSVRFWVWSSYAS